jgi:hypothetical protein
MDNEVTPEDVIDYLVNTGIDTDCAKKAVMNSFHYCNKKYGGQTFEQAVEKISTVCWQLR